jgi:hypothetical protein
VIIVIIYQKFIYRKMGGLMASCFKSRDSGNMPSGSGGNGKGKDKDIHSRPIPAKDRVTDTDKAILDVKARMRKIKTYIDKMIQ